MGKKCCTCFFVRCRVLRSFILLLWTNAFTWEMCGCAGKRTSQTYRMHILATFSPASQVNGWKSIYDVWQTVRQQKNCTDHSNTWSPNLFDWKCFTLTAWQCLVVLFGSKPFNWFSNCCKKRSKAMDSVYRSIRSAFSLLLFFIEWYFEWLDMRYRIELITIPVYSVWTRFSRLLNANPPLDSYRQ